MALPSDLTLHYVDSVDEASQLMTWLGQTREILAFDLETTGINPREQGAAIRLAQLGDDHTGWAIPWDGWGGVFMEAINKYKEPLTGHNTSFDVRWLKLHAGWVPPYHRLHDTMLMAQIEEPNMLAGLKNVGDRHIDRRASVGQKLLKDAMKERDWTWATIPVNFDTYWQYGCVDTILTSHLFNHYRTDLSYPRAYETELAVRRICSQMEDNGMPIDLDYCVKTLTELEERVEVAKDWASENWGINISSNNQLVDFFINRLGQPSSVSTPKGAPSANKEQMDIFANSSDPLAAQAAQYILGIRKAEKLSSTYFSNFIEKEENGILHPSIKTMGARTGRMSVVNPALQTLGRGDAIVRDAFIAREGEDLLSCDYSQIEMRLMAHFSNDESLLEAFRKADSEGGDFFTLLGTQIYNDENFERHDHRRGLVKNVLYGGNYGAGVTKMAQSAGVPYDQMKAVSDSVFTTYPGIKRFQREIETIGSKREEEEGVGYIFTQDGRRLPAEKDKVYTLVNYLLQGTAASLLKEALIRLDNAGYGKNMLIPIHDEVIFSIPKSDTKDAMIEIGECMSVENGFALPFPAEPEFIGDRWGNKYR